MQCIALTAERLLSTALESRLTAEHKSQERIAARNSRDAGDLANCLECTVIDIAAAFETQSGQVLQPSQFSQPLTADLQHAT